MAANSVLDDSCIWSLAFKGKNTRDDDIAIVFD